ncbi:MAG: ATP-dependent RNA helicase HrpA, partial [Candidatus Nitrotoga sp.]
LNIDFLLGYFKQLLPRRADLKLIITSATLDAERFAQHFANGHVPPPIIQVTGRSYPVEVRYRPLHPEIEASQQNTGKPSADKLNESLTLADAICATLGELSVGGLRGDVLVFLPGEREIRETAEALRKMPHGTLEILPLFSRLSMAEQDRIFKPSAGVRRVVLATNVAETSLTVPGIAYVIDSGLARINRYSIRQKVEQLRVEKISRAAANQRAGRCGRVMSGICVRLYDETDFLMRAEYTDAEIFRVSLATVILRMSALNLGSVDKFPFIEAPSSRSIADGYQLLIELGAIKEQHSVAPDGHGQGRQTHQLTALGYELAKLPLDPKIARLLLAGRQFNCLQEILIIASALSLQDPRDRPTERREAADAAHQRFNDERSDFLSYIKLWTWFQGAIKHKKSNRLWAQECHANFLSALRLREWHDLYQQLHAQMVEMGLRLNEVPAAYVEVHKALLCGLLGNIGCKGVDREAYYLGAREIKFHILANSVLAKKGGKWVVAAELVETTRLYARCVARIEPEWLEEVGAHLIKRHYFDPHWEKKAAQVVAFERSTLYGLLIHPKKRVHYGPMHAAESRAIFIRQALVAGEFHTTAAFFAHNQKLIHDIEALEHKARRPDVLVDEELIFAFYDSRIPAQFSGHPVHNGATFEAWRKEAERANPRLLFLQRDDLMRHEAAGITTDQFPPQILMNHVNFSLTYNFAPGKSDDGVTLNIPLALLNQVSAPHCEYLVPGIRAEKITQLVKTLPQKLRRHLVPIPEFAAQFCRTVVPSDTPLLQALTKYIRSLNQLDVPPDAFRVEQLPVHLLMNFHVMDEYGQQLGISRNLLQLREQLAPKLAPLLVKKEAAAVTHFTSWSFSEFQETSQHVRAGQAVTVFNALVDNGTGVSLCAFDTRAEAKAVHRVGLRRLFMLALKEQVKYLEKNIPGALAMKFISLGSQQDLQNQILAVTFERCCLSEPWPRNDAEFSACCTAAKSRLNLVAQEITRLVDTILSEYQQVQKNLAAAKIHTQAAQDIREQCVWLLRKEFIARTAYEHLQHMPRYLKAINVRLDKLRTDSARDARQFAQMQNLLQAWQRKGAAQKINGDERWEDFGWLLQELRVSLFAQELKTAIIISVKRLEKLWLTH